MKPETLQKLNATRQAFLDALIDAKNEMSRVSASRYSPESIRACKAVSDVSATVEDFNPEEL